MKTIREYLDNGKEQGRISSDADAAKKCGVKPATISRWRSGERVPNDDEAVNLAAVLQIDECELLARCGALRAKSQPTQLAWEKLTARIAGATLGLCLLIGSTGDVQAENPFNFKHLLFSELKNYVDTPPRHAP